MVRKKDFKNRGRIGRISESHGAAIKDQRKARVVGCFTVAFQQDRVRLAGTGRDRFGTSKPGKPFGEGLDIF